MLGEDDKAAQIGQGVGVGLIHCQGNGVVVHHRVVVHQEVFAHAQGIGDWGVLPVVVQGKGHVLGGEGLPILEGGVFKEGEGVVAAVHRPALGQPGHVSLLVFFQQAAEHQFHFGGTGTPGLAEERIGSAPVGTSLQLEGGHGILGVGRRGRGGRGGASGAQG